MRMHRARACLACVRRPVVIADSRDARLRQGNARERRVVALRRTVVKRPRWGAAQIQVPVQRRHTVRRASTAHHPPPRMPTPRPRKLGRRLDRSPHPRCRMLSCMRVRTYRDVSACVHRLDTLAYIHTNMHTYI